MACTYIRNGAFFDAVKKWTILPHFWCMHHCLGFVYKCMHVNRGNRVYNNNVLMFSFEGLMKLTTENSQKRTELSEVFTGYLRSLISLIPNKLNINYIIVHFPTYPGTTSVVGWPGITSSYNRKKS